MTTENLIKSGQRLFRARAQNNYLRIKKIRAKKTRTFPFDKTKKLLINTCEFQGTS